MYAYIMGVCRTRPAASSNALQCVSRSTILCVSCDCLKAMTFCNAERIAQSIQLQVFGVMYNSLLPAPLPAPCVPWPLKQVHRSSVPHLLLLHIRV